MPRIGKSFFAFVIAMVFASEAVYADFSAALGPEAGFFWEKAGESEASAAAQAFSLGGGMSVFSIEDGSFWGFFGHFSFLAPLLLTVNKEDVDLRVYDFLLQAAFLAGPGFRFDMGDTFRLNLGVGAHVLYLVAAAKSDHSFYGEYQYSRSSINLGAGAKAELGFNLSSPLYIALGAVFTFDFLNYSQASSPQHDGGGMASNYMMPAVKAYLCVGWRFDDISED
jgi:hypothetical protein